MFFLVAVLVLVVAFSGPIGRDLASKRKLTEPLARVAWVYGTLLVMYLALEIWEGKDGYFGGTTRRGSICVDTGIGGGGLGGAGWRAAHGGATSVTGDVQACVLHPGAADWLLFLLNKLPGLLLWGGVLLMIFRLVRHATNHGPFSPGTAAMVTQLGCLIVAGAMIAAALEAIGANLLTDAVLRPQPFSTGSIVGDVLLFAPLKALFPVPVLAGAALISFGRITSVGAAMDEELKATV
jgi:hypothetical protein